MMHPLLSQEGPPVCVSVLAAGGVWPPSHDSRHQEHSVAQHSLAKAEQSTTKLLLIIQYSQGIAERSTESCDHMIQAASAA